MQLQMGRARAHVGGIPICSLEKDLSECRAFHFSVMHYFTFTFSREKRRKIKRHVAVCKGTSWDFSQEEDTNLIPKKKIGESKISCVRFCKLSCFDNVGLFFGQSFLL